VHEAILRGELVAPAASRAPSPRLVGRRAQLDRLDDLVARAHASRAEIVKIEGEAGIGKTSLLRAWAEQRAARGDLVLQASCGSLDQAVSLDAVLVAIAEALHRLGPDRTSDVLGADADIIGPMIGMTPEGRPTPLLADGAIGPSVLYAALLRILQRMSAIAPLVLAIDDAHLAGPALGEWLQFVSRRPIPLLVVAASRSGLGDTLAATTTLRLGPLDRAGAQSLVGEHRIDELYELSQGNPLFLTQLAVAEDSAALPASLVEAVAAIGASLGPAGVTLRAAAVIGPRLDLDLLAAVLRQSVLDVLEHAEIAVGAGLLVDESGAFWFRHELVRAALTAGTTASRTALLHRQAGRVLAKRADADPVEVAAQARLGGDVTLAATALRTAASRASGRFDHEAAERLLDEALVLHPDADGWLQRARVRTLRGRYGAAYDDVDLALDGGAGAAALEVGAWASYFDRRFDQAAEFARDGELASTDPDVRTRCLTVGGRTRHASGDLDTAQRLLGQALESARGADRVIASAWLGVVRAHQSRVEEALQLLGPAARSRSGVEHTSATLHALLFTGHAQALAGRPLLALDCFARYTEEVERRQVARFAGRGINFGGWVLRNLGACDEANDRHHEALDVGSRQGTAELLVAAHEDLAEDALDRRDIAAAEQHLDMAESNLRGDQVFGWRLAMKLQLLRARLAEATGDPGVALDLATDLAVRADAVGVPRYSSVARLTAARAKARLGLPVDLDAVEHDLDLVDACVAIEAWRITGEMAAALLVPAWVDRAARRMARLADEAGDRSQALRAVAAERLDAWSAAAR